MTRVHLAGCALLAALAIGPVCADGLRTDEALQADVAQLVSAARKRTMLWPWRPPEPEVAVVASHGKAIAPLLVTLLVENPETTEGADLNVQQQVALALCRIYGVPEIAGHVYMNRASLEENARVRAFWLARVALSADEHR